MGRFGRHVQRLAVELVNRRFVTAIASDAHSAQMRTPWLDDIRKILTQEFSQEFAWMLLHDNPQTIIKNEDIHSAAPEWF